MDNFNLGVMGGQVGLQIQHTYAHSLVRFAAKLGPIGWQIAAKRIEQVLPPGTKFGPGWVGANEAPQHSHLPLVTASPLHSSIPQNISPTPCTSTVSPAESPSNSSAVQDRVCETNLPTPSLASNTKDDDKAAQPTINGFNTPLGFTMASQIGKVVESSMPRGSMGLEPRMIHGNTILRSNSTHNYRIPVTQHEVEKAKLAGYSDYSGADQQGVWRGFPQHSQRGSDGPPDLNVGFQSPGSPTSKSVLVDQKQPDLALQL